MDEKTQIEEKTQVEGKPLMGTFSDETKTSFFSPKIIAALIVVAVLGIGTGFFLSQRSIGPLSEETKNSGSASEASKGMIVGSSDTKTFKDTTEGVLEEGGIKGEGQFHLVRPGGESQNVYLTSSIVDLSQFLKKKVKVWGETQKAQYAGWLMDVGRLQVLE